MLPVIEMFTSIQGEGKFAGSPSFFIRVSGCNLRCVFKNSRCDTPYSSFDPEKSPYKTTTELVDAFTKMMDEHPNVYHLVITGGEPMMYRKDMIEFLSCLWDRCNENRDLFITIETNGTFEPFDEEEEARAGWSIDMYSVSPKLSNSVGKEGDFGLTKREVINHNSKRIQIDVLLKYVMTGRYQFKFVYSGPEIVKEIKEIYEVMEGYVAQQDPEGHYLVPAYMEFTSQHPDNHTLLMPEGLTNAQLRASRKECAQICVENGWMYTDRLHIIIWGDKRGV